MEYQLINPINENFNAIEQVLTNRGIKLEDIPHYLNTTDSDILDSSQIDRMVNGLVMLITHINNQDDIMIQIDSDCDGFTSAATLINYLNCIFPEYVQQHIFYRIHEGKQHGIIYETIPKNVKLVIAPDASSNDYEVHKKLNEDGIDVLVIDHHEAEKISEYACVINNQLCDYPTKSLSGVGMVYKFCCEFDKTAETNHADKFLDLVALGMTADMMSLKDFETKHLINKGINQLRNPYFKEMSNKNSFSLGGVLTPIGISFYIAPYVNATIRMGTIEEKTILFESMLDSKAYEEIPSTKRGCKGQMESRVTQAVRNCTNVKNRQTKARDNSLSAIEHIIEEKNLLNNKILVVKLEEFATDKNLTGLIANQLMAKYQRPVLLLNKVVNVITDENEKVVDTWVSWEGSGRGYDKSKFDNLREFLRQSGLVQYAEGHANALGVGIKDSDFNKFIEYSNRELEAFDFNPCYKVDFIYSADDFKPSSILDIAGLKSIWGQGVDQPYIAIERIKISKDNLQLMSRDKNPTLKITLSNGVSLIKFKSSEDEYDSLYSDLGCVVINAVGRCEMNEWNGIVTPQIIIENYEIEEKINFYF